jgi:hypothetical protein
MFNNLKDIPRAIVEFYHEENTELANPVTHEMDQVVLVYPNNRSDTVSLRQACRNAELIPLAEEVYKWAFHDVYMSWLKSGKEGSEPEYTDTTFYTDFNKVNGKYTRDRERYSLIEVDGLTFDSDEQSYKNLVGSLANWTTLINDSSLLERQAIVDGKLLWVLADNSTVYLTQQQIQNVVDAIAVRVVNLQLDYMAVKNT